MSQIQASPFGPLHFYDAPEVALTQILDDEATFGSVVDTFFSPDHLSPIQRDSYADRMKKDLGYDDKGVGAALVDVATNPLVYLAFMFTPAGLRASGRVFGQHVKNSLSALFARNGNEMLMGTAGGEAVTNMQRVIRNLSDETRAIVDPSLASYLETRGISIHQYRNPGKIKDIKLRQEIETDLDLMHIKLAGMDKVENITRTNYIQKFTTVDGEEVALEKAKELHKIYQKKGGELVEDADGAIFRVKTGVDDIIPIDETTKSSKIFDFSAAGGLDNVLRQRGLYDLAEAHRDSFRLRMSRNYLKEGVSLDQVRAVEGMADGAKRLEAAKELIDPNKVIRLKNALQSPHIDESVQLPGFFDRLMSREMRANLMSGKPLNIGDDEFVDLMTRGMANDLFAGGSYFPRNQMDFYTFKRGPNEPFKFVEATGLDRPTFDVKGGRDIRNEMSQMFASGRSARRNIDEVAYLPEDLDRARRATEAVGGQTASGYKYHQDLSQRVIRYADANKAEGRIVPMRRIDFNRSYETYHLQTARDHALYIDEITDLERLAQRESLLTPEGAERFGESVTQVRARAYKKGAEAPRLMQVFEDSVAPPGGWTRADLLEQVGNQLRTVASDTAQVAPELSKLRGEKAYELFRETIIPAALGMRTDQASLVTFATRQAQAVGEKFANSILAQRLSDASPTMKEAMKQIKYFAGRDAAELIDPVRNNAASYLYASHLGMNFGSILLNLQQPFLHLQTIVGMEATIKGMANAADDLTRYARRRMDYGVRITPEQRREILEEVLEFPEEAGIMGDVISDIDRLMDAQRIARGANFDVNKVVDFSLKGFEKTEWMNRLTTVHAMKHNYLARGLANKGADGRTVFGDSVTEQAFRYDATKAVQQFQFGADILGTPMMFMRGPLSDPLLRQFQSFGLRTLTSSFIGGGMVQGGQRFIRGTDIEVPFRLADPLRMIGVSALIYEGAKGLIGADLSRGGAIESYKAFANPEKLARGEFPFVVPPVIGISASAFEGVMKGDVQLIGDAMARSVPGGIALQRALQVAPDAKSNFLTSLASPAQKFYGDYENMTPDGLIPIKKSDGTLVDYQSPSSLILRALGANLSLPQYSRDIDGYMVRQRDQINQQRRRWIDAVVRKGDVAEGEKINAEFQRKYGFRLPVTTQQIKAAVKGMETPRSLRMMDRMPPEIRSYFQQEAASRPQRLQTPEEVLLNMPTTSQRQAVTPTQVPVSLSPEVLQEIKRSIQETEKQRELLQPEVFERFGGF
tara:strand:+ start:11600 stop:15382 length:3783 start_codon:yes stop_codon:yes gene_type:complete